MPNLLVVRETRGSGSALTFDLCVDGVVVAHLANGQSSSLNISRGRHAVQVRYDQWFHDSGRFGGTSQSKGESSTLNIEANDADIVLRCGFADGLAGFFSGSSPFLKAE